MAGHHQTGHLRIVAGSHIHLSSPLLPYSQQNASGPHSPTTSAYTLHATIPGRINTWDPARHRPRHGTDIIVVPVNQLFMDNTGRFSPRSRSGNQYIMVAIHCPSNAILIRPFASKHDTHQIAAYQDIYQRLAVHGAVPTLHILDNEISMAFQHAITTN